MVMDARGLTDRPKNVQSSVCHIRQGFLANFFGPVLFCSVPLLPGILCLGKSCQIKHLMKALPSQLFKVHPALANLDEDEANPAGPINAPIEAEPLFICVFSEFDMRKEAPF